MFGWFKKKEDPKVAAAYRKGQELGAQMSEAVDNWFTNGLRPYRQVMLDGLRESLRGYDQVQNVPPAYFVRAKLADFYDAVTERQPQVKRKTFEVLQEWLEVSDIMEMRSSFEQLIEKRLSDFQVHLRLEGLEAMTENVPHLVEADKLWRATNPELSLRYPPVGDPNYKDDDRNVMPF